MNSSWVVAIRRVGLGVAVVTAAAVVSACSHAGNPVSSHSSAPPPTAAAAQASSTPSPVASPLTSAPAWSTPSPISSAWLAPAQLPDDQRYQWTVVSSARAMPFAQDIDVPLCPGVSGENAWLLDTYRGVGIMSQSVEQQTFLYPNESEASQTYSAIVAGMPGCQTLSRSYQARYGAPAMDALVSEITGTTHASAWVRSWTGVSLPVSIGGPQTDIEFIAQQGPAISFFDYQLSGLDQQAPSVATSATLLATMTSELGAYRQGS